MSAHIRNYDHSQDAEDRQAAADKECARLRGQHALLQHVADGKLIWAPLPESNGGLNVLDSAGADGTWSRASKAQIPDDRYSKAWFLTTDLDAYKFPAGESAETASDLKGSGFEFLVHDFTDSSWPAELHSRFDLVHQRLVLAASAKNPIVTTLQRFGTLLKPGTGWLQLVELDISPQEGRDSAVEDYMALLNAVAVSTGVRPYFATGLKADLVDAGFVDVSEALLRVPIGAAVERKEFREQSTQNMASFCARFVELAKKFQLSVDEDLPRRLEEILRTQGSWLVFRVVYGRKP